MKDKTGKNVTDAAFTCHQAHGIYPFCGREQDSKFRWGRQRIPSMVAADGIAIQ